MNNLYHYTNIDNFILDYNKKYKISLFNLKPDGLWISIDNSWEEWCRDNEFKLDAIQNKYKIELNDNSNILIINTINKFKEFYNRYKTESEIGSFYKPDWGTIKNKYDGIIISPYFYQLRLEIDYLWYSIWDCSSGCIWNLNSIKSIILDNTYENKI